MVWSLAFQPFLKIFGQMKVISGVINAKPTLYDGQATTQPVDQMPQEPSTMPHPTRQVAIVTGALVRDRPRHGAPVLQNGCGGGGRAMRQGVESPDQALALKAELGEQGDRIGIHPLDLAHSASIHAFFTEVLGYLGPAGCAGQQRGLVGTATVADYATYSTRQDELLLHINAAGTLTLTHLFVAQLRRQRGDLALAELPAVSRASARWAAAWRRSRFRLADGMSKVAVAFMTRQIAAEHVHTPLDVFAICPGATNTGMFQASTLNAMTDAERAAFIDRLPNKG